MIFERENEGGGIALLNDGRRMRRRILHTSDLHLVSPEDKACYSLVALVKLANRAEVDLVIIAKPKKATGIGVVEAPRGTLYYRLDLDEKGIVTFADLCIPTQQNIIHLEKDIAAYVEYLLKQNKTKQQISMQVEKMIRAYDPCMSCATHFLKINWV